MSVRVMIVDDTDHVRRMLVDILDLHGFSVVGEAANGAEAVERAVEFAPDVIVMDYKMPVKDGIEATREIRERLPDLRVILYSAFVDRAMEERAREAGVSVCIAKGSGVEALAREISALVMDFRERSDEV